MFRQVIKRSFHNTVACISNHKIYADGDNYSYKVLTKEFNELLDKNQEIKIKSINLKKENNKLKKENDNLKILNNLNKEKYLKNEFINLLNNTK